MNNLSDSKYLKNRENRFFYIMSEVFLVAMLVMPAYFGIPVPGFDLTAIRIMIIVLMVMICCNRDRLYDFFRTVKYNQIFLVLLPYLFVIVYTTVFRTDLKAFLNPFIEILTFFLLIYTIKDCLGVEKTLAIVIGCYYLFAVQGIIEYPRGESLFKLLKTLDGNLVGGNFVRGGQYRIMGPAPHSLGYGLMLVIGFPLTTLDLKNKTMYLFQRPVLFLLIIVNIVFTGSRSALAIFFVQLILVFILSSKSEKKKTLLFGTVGFIVLMVILVALSGTSIGNYFMLQITGVVDEVFGTTFSLNYGATLITQQSSDYRDYLWYVFQVSWLNPLIGIGRSRSFSTVINGVTLESLDNFYIAEYVRYAYPGMFSYIFFMVFMIVKMLIKLIKKPDDYTKVFLISAIGYAMGIYFTDTLSTLKYLYLIFALFICYADDMFVVKSRKKKSKYLRQAL